MDFPKGGSKAHLLVTSSDCHFRYLLAASSMSCSAFACIKMGTGSNTELPKLVGPQAQYYSPPHPSTFVRLYYFFSLSMP